MHQPQPPIEEMRIELYPRVSYGVPLEEHTTSLELNALPNAPDVIIEPSKMQQLANSSQDNFTIDNKASGIEVRIGLTKEEKDLVPISSANTKTNEDSNKGIEMWFFDTIEKYGSQQLKLLLQETTFKFEKDNRFLFYA